MSIELSRARAALVEKASQGLPQNISENELQAELFLHARKGRRLKPEEKERLSWESGKVAQRMTGISSFMKSLSIAPTLGYLSREDGARLIEKVMTGKKKRLNGRVFITPFQFHIAANRKAWRNVGVRLKASGMHLRESVNKFISESAYPYAAYGSFSIGVRSLNRLRPDIPNFANRDLADTRREETFHAITSLLGIESVSDSSSPYNIMSHMIRAEGPPKLLHRLHYGQSYERMMDYYKQGVLKSTERGLAITSLNRLDELLRLGAPNDIVRDEINAAANHLLFFDVSQQYRTDLLEHKSELVAALDAQGRISNHPSLRPFLNAGTRILDESEHLHKEEIDSAMRLGRLIHAAASRCIEAGQLTPLQAALHMAGHPLAVSHRDFSMLASRARNRSGR